MQEAPLDIEQFETKVDEKELRHGYTYYTEGRVKNIFNINGVEWQAVVEGLDDYVVSLRLTGKQVERLECNCPYTGDLCRHAIAVLYYIRTEGDKSPKYDDSGYSGIKENISYMPPHVLRYLILKYAASSRGFRKFLMEFFLPRSGK
ncbi:MAG: SWIM zinc finger family protein [Chitinophagales bacterium]